MPLTSGIRLGPYEIQSALGAGGMGEVYRARDTRLGRDVAIKVLTSSLAADARFRERFEREARVVASLNHPHICTIYDVGQHDGATFLVMEYLEGETLAARLARGRAPLDTVAAWGIQLADALALAHARGVVHRDLKPANIMLVNGGSPGTPAVKVLDFGLAKTAVAATVTLAPTMAETDAGVAVGTVAYMSPEQARGEPLDARSDIFSLGTVLYEIVTGQAAFPGATSAVVFDTILNRPVRPLRDAVPEAPAELADIIDRMLAKRAGDRYPDGAAIATALRQVQARHGSGRVGSGAVAARMPSIAVLPFMDMSAQKDQDYFCEGMAEELINALSKLAGLRVASRTSAFRFRGAEDIRKIGEQLGVETVLEGSVRTAGTRLRVSAQLTSVADGYQIWSERYDRHMEDVFEIQDEIARAIVGALKVRLLGEPDAPIVKRATDNVEAYHLCLKARYHWYKWTDDGFVKATELFQQALALDPNYPLALFGLADSYFASSHIGFERNMDECEALFKAAIRADPELAEAHAIYGLLLGWWRRRWDYADRSLETAVQLAPRSPHVRCAYGLHLATHGKFESALVEARRGVELDPLVPFWNVLQAQISLAAGTYPDAIRQANAALELMPRYPVALGYRGLAEMALGRFDAAAAALKDTVVASSAAPYYVGWYGCALARAGRRGDAHAELEGLLERDRNGYLPPLSVAIIYAGLDDTANALEWLERACDREDPALVQHLVFTRIFDRLQSDPRFADLRRRVFGA